jgi:tetratricopeptide (TPR) repeat protein
MTWITSFAVSSKKGRSFATLKGHYREGQMNGAKAWFHALELHERSHVSNELPDKSLIFAIYSGVMVFVKGGMILQDDEQSFEQNLDGTFCQNTKSLLDPIHNARALAVYCEVLGRLGRYEEALATFDTHLADTYIIEEHSHVFVNVYGTEDRAAQMYSQRAYWYYGLGKLDDAGKCCEDVIQKILPWMETKNMY